VVSLIVAVRLSSCEMRLMSETPLVNMTRSVAMTALGMMLPPALRAIRRYSRAWAGF